MPAREPLAPILAALTKRAAEIVTVEQYDARDGTTHHVAANGAFSPPLPVDQVNGLAGFARALLVAAWRGPGLVEERQHAGEGTAKRTPDRLALAEQDECHGAANAAVNYDGNAVHSPTWNAAYQCKAREIRARKSPASQPAVCTACGKVFATARATPDEWQCPCGGVIVVKSPVAPPVPPRPETRPMLTEWRHVGSDWFRFVVGDEAIGSEAVSVMVYYPRRHCWSVWAAGKSDERLAGDETLPDLESAKRAADAAAVKWYALPADPAPPQPDHYPRSPRDEEEREACEGDDYAGRCNIVRPNDPNEYTCSRHPHVGGDCVAGRLIDGVVLARWPQSAPPQPHDTRKPLDAAIRDLAACYDRMASEERSQDKASVYLRAAADLWRTVDGARGSTPQPHDGERATCSPAEQGFRSVLTVIAAPSPVGEAVDHAAVLSLVERMARAALHQFPARFDAPPPGTRPEPETHAPERADVAEPSRTYAYNLGGTMDRRPFVEVPPTFQGIAAHLDDPIMVRAMLAALCDKRDRLCADLAGVGRALCAAVDGDVEPGETLVDTVERLAARIARLRADLKTCSEQFTEADTERVRLRQLLSDEQRRLTTAVQDCGIVAGQRDKAEVALKAARDGETMALVRWTKAYMDALDGHARGEPEPPYFIEVLHGEPVNPAHLGWSDGKERGERDAECDRLRADLARKDAMAKDSLRWWREVQARHLGSCESDDRFYAGTVEAIERLVKAMDALVIEPVSAPAPAAPETRRKPCLLCNDTGITLPGLDNIDLDAGLPCPQLSQHALARAVEEPAPAPTDGTGTGEVKP